MRLFQPKHLLGSRGDNLVIKGFHCFQGKSFVAVIGQQFPVSSRQRGVQQQTIKAAAELQDLISCTVFEFGRLLADFLTLQGWPQPLQVGSGDHLRSLIALRASLASLRTLLRAFSSITVCRASRASLSLV